MISTATDLILTDDELRVVSGYAQPAKMLAELRRQGFFRARRGPNGIILERAHYLAVCESDKAGGKRLPGTPAPPRLRP